MTEPAMTGGASNVAAYVETATGVALMTAPFWAQWLYAVNIVAAAIASVCGAIVGVTAVCRILRRPRHYQSSHDQSGRDRSKGGAA